MCSMILRPLLDTPYYWGATGGGLLTGTVESVLLGESRVSLILVRLKRDRLKIS